MPYYLFTFTDKFPHFSAAYVCIAC